jgi:ribonuclease HII
MLPPGLKLAGLNDSKQVGPENRLRLEARIKAHAIWAVVEVDVETIDRLNILWASMEAMRRAVLALATVPTEVLVDGNRLPPEADGAWRCVVRGDARVAEIAAASILAKTARDRRMAHFALDYPAYGFERHFGYPTPEHLEALRRHGPCPLHRRAFGPVREAMQTCLELD